MKKSLILGIIGLATAAATSYGQGYISLDNYAAALSGNALIYYGPGSGGPLGTPINSTSWTVGVYFAAGSVASDLTPGSDMPTGLALGSGGGSTTAMYGPAFPGLFQATSYFQASPLTTATTVTIEVVAYNGADYADSLIRAHSAAFTMTTAVGTSFVTSVGDDMAPAGFSVTPVPEPTTLALGGLGGLAMLLMRRKKA